MTRATIEPIAAAQLEDIHRYSSERWGEAQADVYIRGIFAVIERIADRKLPWRAVSPRFGVSGYLCRHEKHYIYWRERSDGHVGVVAILHERMHQDGRVRQAFDLSD